MTSMTPSQPTHPSTPTTHTKLNSTKSIDRIIKIDKTISGSVKKKKETKLEKDRKKEDIKMKNTLMCWLDRKPLEDNDSIDNCRVEKKVVKTVNNLVGKYEKLEAAAGLQNLHGRSKTTVRMENTSANTILEVNDAVNDGIRK